MYSILGFSDHHICDQISMHKLTIYRKTLQSSFLHHPLTELLLITTMYIVLKLYNGKCDTAEMYIPRNAHFQFRICTPFTNSPRTNHFILDKYIQSSWTKLCQMVLSRG